jgi:hypothetical protein
MAIYYVDYTSGNDTTGDGSYSTPYKTVAKAHTIAASGDTITIKTGVYTLTATLQEDLYQAKDVIINTESGDPTTTYYDGGDTYSYRIYDSRIDKTLNVSGLGLKNMTAGASYICYGNNVTQIFDNCLFENCAGPGAGWGVFYYGAISNNLDVRIRNCVFNDLPATPYNGVVMVTGGTSTRVRFYNNTQNYVNGIPSLGILSSYNQSGTDHYWYMFNNIIINKNSGSTISLYGLSTANVINLVARNNNLYTVGATISNNYGTPATSNISGSFTTEPLFLDYANGDFRPTADSPVINAGAVIV